jgi:hypothetical protein
MMKFLTLIICIYSSTVLLAQNELRKPKEGTREVKASTKETNAMSNEFRGIGEKEAASPAKSYIKKFWEYVGKMEAAPNDVNILGTNSRAAGTAIGNIQTKDKNYDVAPLEAELGKWRAKYDAALNGKGSVRGANNSMLDLFTLLYQVNTHVPPADVEKKLAEIQNYKMKTAELVALNIDPKDKVNAAYVNTILPRTKKDLSDLDGMIKRLEQNLTSIEDERNLRAWHTILQYELAHWDALRNGPFTDKTPFADGYNKVSSLVTRLGSIENMIKAGKVREQQRIKNTKMPPALIQNAETERLFRQAFEDAGWKETIIKINLLDRDWKAIRNEITGVVEARTQRAAIAIKTKGGDFLLYNYLTIQQDYLGNAFSNQAKIIYHESSPILQENIK